MLTCGVLPHPCALSVSDLCLTCTIWASNHVTDFPTPPLNHPFIDHTAGVEGLGQLTAPLYTFCVMNVQMVAPLPAHEPKPIQFLPMPQRHTTHLPHCMQRHPNNATSFRLPFCSFALSADPHAGPPGYPLPQRLQLPRCGRAAGGPHPPRLPGPGPVCERPPHSGSPGATHQQHHLKHELIGLQHGRAAGVRNDVLVCLVC